MKRPSAAGIKSPHSLQPDTSTSNRNLKDTPYPHEPTPHGHRRPTTRPPDNAYFQKDRDTLEKRSGRWLKELVRQSQTTEFDLNNWILAWDGSGKGRQIPGRN